MPQVFPEDLALSHGIYARLGGFASLNRSRVSHCKHGVIRNCLQRWSCQNESLMIRGQTELRDQSWCRGVRRPNNNVRIDGRKVPLEADLAAGDRPHFLSQNDLYATSF